MYPYNKNDRENKSEEGFSKRPSPADRKIIEMLIEALKDETMDYNYYGKLANLARTQEDKEIIKGVQMDEQKHFLLISDIYFKMTGEKPKVEAGVKPISRNLLREYEKSILSEINGMEFYRKLYFSFLNVQIRDMIFEILTDEQQHSTKFTYLFAKNK